MCTYMYSYLHVFLPFVTGEGHDSEAGSAWAPLGSFVMEEMTETPESHRTGERQLQLIPIDVGDSTGVSQRFLGVLYTHTWQTRSNTKTTILGMSQATLSPWRHPMSHHYKSHCLDRHKSGHLSQCIPRIHLLTPPMTRGRITPVMREGDPWHP